MRRRLSNFSKALRRDAALDSDRLSSAHTLINYDIDEVQGGLRKRRGSSRWNVNALPTEPKQTFHFSDPSGIEYVLVVGGDGKLYRVDPDGTGTAREIKIDGTDSHNMSNPPYPFVIAGDRVFFADGSDWYWADRISLDTSPDATSYVSVMGKPNDPVAGGDMINISTLGVPAGNYGLDILSFERIAQSVQLGVFFIDNITNANPGKITIVGVPTPTLFFTGQRVKFTSVGGMTELNGNTYTITRITRLDFSIDVDTTGFGTYTSGGLAALQNVYQVVSNVELIHFVTGDVSGSFRFSLQTSDLSGNPSGVLLSEDSRTEWIDANVADGVGTYDLISQAAIQSDMLVWGVIESNRPYKDNFSSGTNFLAFEYNSSASSYPLGEVKRFDTVNWWGLGTDLQMSLGPGTTQDGDYKYRFSYLNSDNKSESLPSDIVNVKTASFVGTDSNHIGSFGTAPDSANKIAIYRTDSIDEIFRLLISLPSTAEWVYDSVADGRLALEMDNLDHLNIQTSLGIDTKPSELELFKSRLMALVPNEDTVVFSKQLENIGLLGLTGDPILTAFPAGNRFEIETSGIAKSIKSLSVTTDQGVKEVAAIYFDNSIGLFSGFNSPLNPPDDLQFNMVINGVGLIGRRAVTKAWGRHVFLSRKGVYVFDGTRTLLNLSNGHIDTILLQISDVNLSKSILHTGKDGVWMALDENNDGVLDSMYQINLRDIVEQGITQEIPEWKVKQYNFAINDFIIRNSGQQKDQILVATNLSDNFLRQIENGTGTDVGINGEDILVSGTVRTHKILPTDDRNRQFITSHVERDLRLTGISLTGKYPNNVVPSYDGTVRDKDESETLFELLPDSETDKRGHRTGVRVKSMEIDVEIVQTSFNRDEIKEIVMEWI